MGRKFAIVGIYSGLAEIRVRILFGMIESRSELPRFGLM